MVADENHAQVFGLPIPRLGPHLPLMRSFLSALLVLILILVQPVLADLAFPTTLSADIITKNSQIPGGSMKAKFYMDGNDRIRTESNFQGMENIVIMRRDKNVMYTLMPAQKMAMEMPMPGDVPNFIPDTTKGPKPERLGEETIEGVACIKWKIKSEQGDGTETFFWTTKDNIPVRMATADGTTQVDWKNVSTAKPDSSLFEVPAGYTKQSMPSMPQMPNP
jgi:hypothetical protein